MGKLVTDEDGEGSDTEGVSVERTARGTESLMTNAPDIKPPVIIISGIRWDFLWQRHQIFATLFARAGYPTVYVETTGLRNPSFDPDTARIVIRRIFRAGSKARKTLDNTVPNLAVYSPLVAPPTWKIFRHLNRTVFVPRVARDLRHLLNGVSPAVIAYPPTSTTLDLLSLLTPAASSTTACSTTSTFPVPRATSQRRRISYSGKRTR